jgi:cytoskeletal protein CcmA (bactofilin family)
VGDIHYQEILIEKGAKITGKLVRLSWFSNEWVWPARV